VWRDQAALEVFQRVLFGVERVGVTDVEVEAGGGALGIVFGPFAQVHRHRSAVDKPVPLRAYVGACLESELAVAVKGDIQISDGDERVTSAVGCRMAARRLPIGCSYPPDGGVHSGGRAGQATILAPSPNLVSSHTRSWQRDTWSRINQLAGTVGQR
jgi:hypothetical protein